MNKGIKVTLYLFMLIFAAMIIYFGNFLANEKDDYISSSHNSRLNSYSENVRRGNILSSDGQILAKTVVDEEGNESREYPFDNLFAHSVGYTLKSKTGIEAIGNFYMVSSAESAFSKIKNNFQGNKHLGNNVVTTLDVSLQQTVYDVIGDRRAACVVLEPDTGRILAMVSKPDFNPNTLEDEWDELVSNDDNSCLLNRATRGLYPPGSTFKLLTALEYIREYPDVYGDYAYNCMGTVPINDKYAMSCYGNAVHGALDLKDSLSISCNCSLSNIGLALNKSRFAGLCEDFLFNQMIPGSYGCSDSVFNLSVVTDNITTVQTAIGQGETLVSPMHNALIVSAIANGGTLMVPYVIDRIESADGKVVTEFSPTMYDKIMTAEESELFIDMMKAVVNEGTGDKLKTDDYQAAGKTGSAQFSSDTESTHAWFVGFAPADKPKIVISIIFEKGGTGGGVAASAAKEIFDAYLVEK